MVGEDSFEVGMVRPTERFDSVEAFESYSGGRTTMDKILDADAFSHPSANLSARGRFDFETGNGLFRRSWVSAPASTRASDGLGPLFNARACQSCHVKDGRGHAPAANWPDDDALSMLFKLGVPMALKPDDGDGVTSTAPDMSAGDGDGLAVTSTAPDMSAGDGDGLAVTSTAPDASTGDGLAVTSTAPDMSAGAGVAAAAPDPVYGFQIQDAAVAGHQPEGRVDIVYDTRVVELDGQVVRLRAPRYRLRSLAYGEAHPEVLISGRVAPPMIGLGLLAAIDERDILAGADPSDQDGDGISGRARMVWSRALGARVLGRFGWKATQATLEDQSALAFAQDMGLSTPLQLAPWGDCTLAQELCQLALHGNDGADDAPELSQTILDLVVFYSANLAVPVRRQADDAQVLRGKAAFYASGCTGCHTPKFVTSAQPPPGLQAQAGQLIWPYSDFLLHDMGPGLNDGVAEAGATGGEWRTPPLWGIGLTRLVSEQAGYLHDGRARTLLEAVLWHDGEARASVDRFRALSADERTALLAFLRSL